MGIGLLNVIIIAGCILIACLDIMWFIKTWRMTDDVRAMLHRLDSLSRRLESNAMTPNHDVLMAILPRLYKTALEADTASGIEQIGAPEELVSLQVSSNGGYDAVMSWHLTKNGETKLYDVKARVKQVGSIVTNLDAWQLTL